MNKKIFIVGTMLTYLSMGIDTNVFAVNPTYVSSGGAHEAAILASFNSFAVSAFADADFDLNSLSLSNNPITFSGVDGNDYWCYDVELNDQYYGYAIFGLQPDTDNVRLIEYSMEESPYDVAVNKYNISAPQFVYAGPMQIFALDHEPTRSLSNAIDLSTGNACCIPYIDTFGEWLEVTNSPITFNLPPENRSEYEKISFYNNITFTLDIEHNLSGIDDNIFKYGCGPAAGSCLIYTLGERNDSYSNMLYSLVSPYPVLDAYDVGDALVQYMNPLFGTTLQEFVYGLERYMDNYNHAPDIYAEMRSESSLLGSPTTTSNLAVWDNLVEGIDANKPVALLAGNPTNHGSDTYPDTGDTSTMYYHWVTVLGYLEDTSSSNAGLYVYARSAGNPRYLSFSALCYWRDALGTVYIDEVYS